MDSKPISQLKFLKFGVGAPLVILPSPLIMAANYRKLATHLSQYFQVYILELPGSGLNPSSNEILDLNELTQFVISFLYEQKIEKTLLLGHSNSGPLALATAVHAPRLIKGLILADSIGMAPQSPTKFLIRRFWDAILEFKFSVCSCPHLLYNFLNHTQNFFHQLNLSFRMDITGLIAMAEVDTLIAWGEKDHTLPVWQAHRLHGQMSYPSLYLSPNGSHDWILTDPKKITSAIVNGASPTLKKGSLYVVSNASPPLH